MTDGAPHLTAGFWRTRRSAAIAGIIFGVLFADASRIRISDLRADLGRCVRLLGVGLPLTIASGAVLSLTVIRSSCCGGPAATDSTPVNTPILLLPYARRWVCRYCVDGVDRAASPVAGKGLTLSHGWRCLVQAAVMIGPTAPSNHRETRLEAVIKRRFKSMSSPDELTFGNSVAAIHDVDALTTWRCRHSIWRATQCPSEYGYMQAGRLSLAPRLAPDLTEVLGRA